MNDPVVRLLRLARPVMPRLALAVLAGAAAAGSAIGLMVAAAWLISRAAQHPPVLTLTVAIVAVRAFAISRGVLRYAERLVGHDAALRVLVELRLRCYDRLERLAPAGLTGQRGGDLVARFVGDVDAALDVLVRVLLPYAVIALAGAGSVALLAALLPAAGIVLAVGLIVVALGVPALQHALARRAERRIAPLRGELAAGTVDLLHGLPDLLAYDAADRALAAVAATDARLRTAAARSAGSVGLGGALVAAAAGACVWAGLALGAPAVRTGALDAVLLAVVVLTPLAVFDATTGLPTAAAQYAAGRAALRRVFAVVDRPDPVPEPVTPAPLPAQPQSQLPAPPQSQLPAPPYWLRVEGVAAAWSADRPPALIGVDLDLAPGHRIAVVGPSGSGKSTLAALLVRFLDPTAGRVTLGGVDLRELPGDQVRTVVGLLGDDARLFDTTIEENLRIGRRTADEQELRAALHAARLLDWVDTLPRGLATPVGEHGARLSGGQRRRLALARGLLADFPVLVLDEPTEHLDEPTADALTADLLDATRGRTTLLITHRLHRLDQVDQIVVLDHGRVVQSGHHRELAAMPGPYRDMLRAG